MAGRIASLIVPGTYQLGIVFHAWVHEGAVSALLTADGMAFTAPDAASS